MRRERERSLFAENYSAGTVDKFDGSGREEGEVVKGETADLRQ